MSVVTRFAPSPTGFLHIGGARTALFNWLYARHHGGTFRLRIEDTDRQRSTKEAIQAILDGLTWLGLDWDDEVVHQSARAERHAEVAHRLLEADKAYHCYASQAELEEMRAQQRAAGQPVRYDGRWRDRDPSEAPDNVTPCIRIKMPREGETRIQDEVQGEVTVANAQLDDMVLLRADGSPTYMLSVVVDDHDMGVTHVIRGDDHLTNAFRQHQLYQAMDWTPPTFAHIPLIHGPDGAKMSKRHGAVGLETYRDRHPDKVGGLRGVCEQTATGVQRLRAMQRQGHIAFPAYAVNDTPMKHDFDNVHGTGESSLATIAMTTNLSWASKTVVVAGYGYCGRGVAKKAAGQILASGLTQHG